MDKPLELPSCDDKPLWDVWMAWYHFPTLTAADDLGVFAMLAESPATTEEAAAKLKISVRAAEAMLGVLSGLGFLMQRGGKFFVTEVTRNFLLPTSPYYWGGMLRFVRDLSVNRQSVKDAIVKDKSPLYEGKDMRDIWETHEMEPEMARAFTAAMHTRSLHLGVAMAQRIDFKGVTNFLDVAGGSGCFSIPVAQQHPGVSCTVMELAEVAKLADDYISKFGLKDRVRTVTADMFKDAWPAGQDAVFFSNIYHDWGKARCEFLTKKSFECLNPGGRILIHEVLLADSKDAPLVATTDSIHMVFFTEGKQRTAGEFQELLAGAGFKDVTVTPTYAYYSVVSGRKP